MNWEYSCGAVLYELRDGEPYYILVKGDSGFGFPKGHMEAGESKTETAFREIYEETGVHAALDTDFRRSVEYPVVKKKDTRKEVTFFLATYPVDETPAPRHEIQHIKTVPFEEARELLWLEELKTVLDDADKEIRARTERHDNEKKNREGKQ